MTAYTLFSQGALGFGNPGDVSQYTMGVQFSLSQNCALTGIWFDSITGFTILPSQTAVYRVTGTGTGTLVGGTLSTTPSWSGAAGSGWVKNPYNGSVTLTAGTQYKAVMLGGDGVNGWYPSIAHYWDTTGGGASGITNGPLSAPNNAGADIGQDSFNAGAAMTYPASAFNATNYGIDVEVTPVAAGTTVTVYSMRMIG